MRESAQAFNLSLNCPASVLAARVRICRLEEPEGKTEKMNETRSVIINGTLTNMNSK